MLYCELVGVSRELAQADRQTVRRVVWLRGMGAKTAYGRESRPVRAGLADTVSYQPSSDPALGKPHP
jgi:hypothetical protein